MIKTRITIYESGYKQSLNKVCQKYKGLKRHIDIFRRLARGIAPLSVDYKMTASTSYITSNGKKIDVLCRTYKTT